MEEQKRRRVAYHEAGHAVVAFVLGRRILRVTTVPEGPDLGSCEDDAEELPPAALPLDECGDRLVRIAIKVWMAGELADELFTGQAPPIASSTDRTFAGQRLVYMARAHGEAKAWCEQMRQATTALLMEHGAAVEALAQALIVHREVSGDEAMNIIQAAWPARP